MLRSGYNIEACLYGPNVEKQRFKCRQAETKANRLAQPMSGYYAGKVTMTIETADVIDIPEDLANVRVKMGAYDFKVLGVDRTIANQMNPQGGVMTALLLE